MKTFAELTDAELDRYLAANVERGRRRSSPTLGGVDAALANHLIMGPVILARAGLRYALKVHGSDLSYTVLPELDRFRPYAEEAVAGAAGILVGSGHIAARLRQAVDDPVTNAKVGPRPARGRHRALRPIPRPNATSRSRPWPRTSERRATSDQARTPTTSNQATNVLGLATQRAAAEALDWYAEATRPARDLRRQADRLQGRRPAARRLAAGPRRDTRTPACWWSASAAPSAVLREVSAGLDAGDLAPLRELAARGRGLEGGEDAPLAFLSAFLGDAPGRLRRARPRGRRERSLRGPARARRGRGPGRLLRGARLPEHLPRGLRDGRRRGGGDGRAAGLGRTTRALPRSAERSRPSCRRRPPTWSRSTSTTARSRRSPSRLTGWLALEGGERERAATAPARRCRAPLELGAGGPRRPRRRAGRARRARSVLQRIDTHATSSRGGRAARLRRDQ